MRREQCTYPDESGAPALGPSKLIFSLFAQSACEPALNMSTAT